LCLAPRSTSVVSARPRQPYFDTSHFDELSYCFGQAPTRGVWPSILGLGQAPTRGVTIFLLRNKFLQVVDASLRRRKVRGPVCSVSCVSHFDSARRALNASRTSTHHISTSYRTVANWPSIWPFGQGPSTHP